MFAGKLVNSWSENITVGIAGEKNKFNQCLYTDLVIQGRLIQTTKIVQINEKGENEASNAKLYTTTKLKKGDKVEGFIIIYEKTCKDRNGVVQFYKYYLSKESKNA